MTDKFISSLIIGTILGDAHIRRSKINCAYLTFEQSITKKEYLTHIYNCLDQQNYTLKPINLYKRFDNRYNKTNKSYYFRTKSLKEFKIYSDLFLNDNSKKVIPLNIIDYLNPISLAYWIMDDGQQVKKGGITLCTDSYTFDQVNLLLNALQSKFNITCSIHYKKARIKDITYKRIYIKKNSLEKLKPLLINYMHKSLLYKININH